ncbi:MAG: hypothetical protein EAZ89_10320 [Bacteroidetes bacterium]|nr:MAG: hypothetical protein EAZ89_10320 [Bacteroidota bacterium]
MEADLASRWKLLERQLEERFGKAMTVESLLFLIGIRELGIRPRPFTKEEKTDLMHIAVCRLLSQAGYYQLSHRDQEGWPHWKLIKALPHTDMLSQQMLLREHILTYFDEEGVFEEES